ncbi:hypothetical protein EGM_10764, partial [Macaca fascicularis]
LTRARSESPQA